MSGDRDEDGNGRAGFRVLAMTACLLAAGSARGGNQALVTGAYGGSLGAGGATAAERSAFGQNPAALRPGRIGAHAHFHRPFGLDELQVAEAGVFADGRRFGAAFDWRETGVDGLYAEQALQAAQTLRLGRSGAGFPGVLDLGLSWDRRQESWPGGRTTTAWSHGFGAAWRMHPRFKAGAFLAGMPLETEGAGRRDRVLQWGMDAVSRDPDGAESHGTGSLQTLRLDFRKTGDTPWRALASLSLSPHPSVELTGGLANPPFQASLGIRFAWQGMEWYQAIRYHRYLGRTWLSGFAYSHSMGTGRNP
jgi:hypothetical protein